MLRPGRGDDKQLAGRDQHIVHVLADLLHSDRIHVREHYIREKAAVQRCVDRQNGGHTDADDGASELQRGRLAVLKKQHDRYGGRAGHKPSQSRRIVSAS